MTESQIYHVHILRCIDGSYYVGYTDDLPRRLHMHSTGHGSVWTARRLPVELVHSEAQDDLAKAVAREHQLKRWTRAKKEALVNGERAALRKLSRRRQPAP